MTKLLAVLGQVFLAIWGWWKNPSRQEKRANQRIDKAIDKHDENEVNCILDDNT